MKTKKNNFFARHKRKKNTNKTRKFIQKGGEWIQPLFHIYDDNELNLNNC